MVMPSSVFTKLANRVLNALVLLIITPSLLSFITKGETGFEALKQSVVIHVEAAAFGFMNSDVAQPSSNRLISSSFPSWSCSISRYRRVNLAQSENGNEEGGDTMEKRLSSSFSELFRISEGRSQDEGVTNYTSSFNYQDVDNTLGNDTAGSFYVDRNVTGSMRDGERRDDAPYLSEEIYLESERYLPSDQILSSTDDTTIKQLTENLMFNSNPSVPDVYLTSPTTDTNESDNYKSNDNSIAHEEALLQALAQKNTKGTKNANLEDTKSKEIYDQIFSGEEGYLGQSEIFRKALADLPSSKSEDDGNDDSIGTSKETDATQDALAWRRGAEYRRIQQEALEMIEREMEDLKKNMITREQAISAARNGSNSSLVICSKCACLLTDDEVEHARQQVKQESDDSNKNHRPKNSAMCRICYSESIRLKSGYPVQGGGGRSYGHLMSPSKRSQSRIQNFGPRTEFSFYEAKEIGMKQRRKVKYGEDRSIHPEKWREQYDNGQQHLYQNQLQQHKSQIPRGTETENAESTRSRQDTTTNKSNKQKEKEIPNRENSEKEQIKDLTENISHLEAALKEFNEKDVAANDVATKKNAFEGLKSSLDDVPATSPKHEMPLQSGLQISQEKSNYGAYKQRLKDVGNKSDPWVEVIDPDTGEIFYWNEETEEMRW